MTLSECIKANVIPNPALSEVGGSSRRGTALITLGECAALFGPAHDSDNSPDGKVTKEWHFKTPRGRVTLRDYWWNRDNEQSIASASNKAALWFAAYLRRQGVRAYSGRRVLI